MIETRTNVNTTMIPNYRFKLERRKHYEGHICLEIDQLVAATLLLKYAKLELCYI